MVDCPPMNGYCRDEVTRLENYANGFLTVRSVKLFADGALGSWGAAMIDDYDDKPGNKGTMLLNYTHLESLVRQVPPFPLQKTHLIFSGTKQDFKSTSTQ